MWYWYLKQGYQTCYDRNRPSAIYLACCMLIDMSEHTSATCTAQFEVLRHSSLILVLPASHALKLVLITNILVPWFCLIRGKFRQDNSLSHSQTFYLAGWIGTSRPIGKCCGGWMVSYKLREKIVVFTYQPGIPICACTLTNAHETCIMDSAEASNDDEPSVVFRY